MEINIKSYLLFEDTLNQIRIVRKVSCVVLTWLKYWTSITLTPSNR